MHPVYLDVRSHVFLGRYSHHLEGLGPLVGGYPGDPSEWPIWTPKMDPFGTPFRALWSHPVYLDVRSHVFLYTTTSTSTGGDDMTS